MNVLVITFLFLSDLFLFFVINNRHGILKRRERDSNPRNPLGVYTLSRRASSTTRASLQKRATASLKRVQNTKKIAYPNVSVHKSIVFA